MGANIFSSTSSSFLRDVYTRMLLTRIVDDCTWRLHEQGQIGFVASSRGHEAAQVGSAVCIEIGKDFTLPYYRDLGVVLNLGMTPYEIFRTYLLTYQQWLQNCGSADDKKHANAEMRQSVLHWGYHKHNMVTGPAPVATQILHAAGIAFASKLRKAPVVTVAYCGDGATAEPDFLEGITFSTHHRLPVVVVCEKDCSDVYKPSLQGLPATLEHQCIDGSDVLMVYTTMRAAMQHAREGHGPVLLELSVVRSTPGQDGIFRSHFALLSSAEEPENKIDPLLCCQRLLAEQGLWDERWATQLEARLQGEVEQAMQDALRDVSRAGSL